MYLYNLLFIHNIIHKLHSLNNSKYVKNKYNYEPH